MSGFVSDRSCHNLHPSARRGPAGNYGIELHEYYDRVKPAGNSLAKTRPPPGGSFVAEAPADQIGGTQRSVGPFSSVRSLGAAGNAVVGSPSPSSKRSVASGMQARPQLMQQRSAPLQQRSAPSKDWQWCLGGRKQPNVPRNGGVPELTAELSRSMSSPSINMGPSMLTGKPGQPPEPFFGESREFGLSVWDGRMRGGANARNGWAGTFPSTHPRGCAPWAH
mmetsp:Transcript_22987/g.36718  ORF Transcript_22987/g.36718 Transcript_22987/m.36718 type:complete len:222 (+) Transcript_22987:79-744(+)|eukprot:CAMPEP_0169125522 /NCGR_PEP_ID=MMETSP1015-20121227/34930_1 /TAXON_ID=342587 /ORGANISM="Karlodinium micrum, Strain CCMP2283" /LENGTH=221 /DNA_ID=CAMNT_0009189065 /DNA_START=78 /DNA_END=743 /DNA_ORIENTATION=+